MPDPDIPALARQSTTLMRRRLGARGATLAATLAQTGRRLPRKVRRSAESLAEAEAMANHPRLRVMVDTDAASRAGRAVVAYLQPLGAAERRRRLVLSILASWAFTILATAGGVIGVLVWRGFL